MERVRMLKITVLGMVLVLAGAGLSAADTHYVSAGQSIQAAINAATDGDQIEVAAGTYHEAIDFKGKAVRLYSAGGPDVTTIDGNNAQLLLEDFNDGTYLPEWQIVDQGTTSAPSVWSAATGEMVQSSNIYTEPTTNPAMRGTFALWKAGLSWTDYTVTLTMKSEDNDAMGLMFRYQDPCNYYRFAWLNENHNQGVGRRQLGRTVNGTHTVQYSDDVPYNIGQKYQVRIKVYGQALDIFINDVPFVTNGGCSTFTGGSIALYCWGNQGTHFDDINVPAYHVVQCVSGENANTILEGFTITGGSAYEPISPLSDGGGMFNDHSSPTVKNCIFTGNAAKHGGGIYDSNSSPTVTNCNFLENFAQYGGGMYNNGSSNPTVANCNFYGNTANTDGGGIYDLNSSPTVTDCNFIGNEAGYGGGMYDLNSSPTVTNCVFTGNTANIYGGGMRNANSSSPTVTNCNFSGNTADYGGGMLNDNYSSPTVKNCVFTGNTANIYGGGMLNDTSSPTVTNCTFSGNTADYGGGMFNYNNSPTVTNCIFWNDTLYEFYNLSTPTVTYSDIQGGTGQSWFGTGCIDTDPCFIDAAAGDLRLRPGSPCIDDGNNTAVPSSVLKDLAGKLRFADDPYTPDTGIAGTTGRPVVDMGAYEFQGCGAIPQNLLANPGFETGTATGWITNWGWNLTATTEQIHSGIYSGLTSGRTASWQGAWQSVQGLMEDGRTYRISGWVRLQNADSNTVYLSVKKTDLSGTHYYTIDNATAYSSQWIHLDGTLALDINGQPTELYVYFDGPAPDVNFYVDDVAVTEVTGDIDHNGGIDFFDFGLFASYYGFDCAAQDCGRANLYDCDNTINLLDLAILVSDWLVGVE